MTDNPSKVEPKLTAARKDRIAAEITAVVDQGACTFGQIRRVLGETYSDRELRAGIRTAKRWRTRLKPAGTRSSPKMIRKQVRLGQTGRRYHVIEV